MSSVARSGQRSAAAPSQASDRLPMNAMDCGMLALDRVLREFGVPGFETQALVWLASRADAERLRAGVARLSRRHPLLGARLIEASRREGSCWQLRPGAESPLHEVNLPAADDQAVREQAAALLSMPHDPAEADPVRFHLLHRPDGRDVLVMQYSHVLLDNTGVGRLLRELDALCGAGSDEVPDDRAGASLRRVDASARHEERDPLAAYAVRFPRRRRWLGALAVVAARLRELRGRPALLLDPEPREPRGPVRFGLATRVLDADKTRAWESHVARACGIPSLSMDLLGGAFRAMDRLMRGRGPGSAPANGREPGSRRAAGRSLYIADLGVDLGLRGPDGPLFQTLSSIVPLGARARDLGDRDELTRRLSGQLRARLARGHDLGVLQCAAFCAKRPWLARWTARRIARHGLSLWYAYFGALDALGDRFCGARIETVCHTSICCPPVGLALLANKYQGRLCLQATYIPGLVSEDLAEQFLDELTGDLVTGIS